MDRLLSSIILLGLAMTGLISANPVITWANNAQCQWPARYMEGDTRPSRTIPYSYPADHTPELRTEVEAGFDKYRAANTGWHYQEVPHDDTRHPDRVHVESAKPGDSSHASGGYQPPSKVEGLMGSLGEPKNFIKLNMKQVRGMQPLGTVSGHGISHLHDLIHMHRHPDSTAKMRRENLLHPEDPAEPQWAKINREYIRDVNNAGYDPKSITHYPSTAGAKWDDRKPSKRHPSGLRAVLKDKYGHQIPAPTELSTKDKAGLKTLAETPRRKFNNEYLPAQTPSHSQEPRVS